MGKQYPPTGPFRLLARDDQITRLDVAVDLSEMIQFIRGDPRLSSWEEGFLASIGSWLRISRGKVSISPKQWEKLWEIMNRVAEDAEETGDEEELEVSDEG